MAAQDIYLSPSTIIKYLRLIESKIPRPKFNVYSPDPIPDGVLTNDIICKQAQKMFEFAGLKGYLVMADFASLPEGVGGQILLTDGNIVQINISTHYRNNFKATMAVLAHEICHKVLSVNNLTFPDTLTNETYTDLTTIYIGFGKLILDGCITQSGLTTHFLGYLTPDTYRNTHLLVCAIYGTIPLKEQEFRSSDIFIEEALTRWDTFPEKERILEHFYIKRSQKYNSLYKETTRLEQLLKHLHSSLVYFLEQFNNQFYQDTGVSVSGLHNKLSAFAVIYDQCVWEKDFGEYSLPKSLLSINEAISKATYDIFVKYQETNPFEFSNIITCPFCGESILGSRNDSEIYVDNCPKCKKHIIVDRRPWNPTIRQREIKDAIQKEQLAFENRVKITVEEQLDQIKIEFDKKVRDIRSSEQELCKKRIQSSLPMILKPLFNKYIR